MHAKRNERNARIVQLVHGHIIHVSRVCLDADVTRQAETRAHARKHSGARTVTVNLSQTPDSYRLIVEDDGRGIDPQKVLHKAKLSASDIDLFEINEAFLIVPPLIAMCMTILLSRICVDTRIAGGLGLASYYVLVCLIFATRGGGEFPYEILIIWIALVFLFGFLSTAAVDLMFRFREHRS